MNKMKIGTGDSIVVCDGRKALILENLGDRMFPNLHTKEVRENPTCRHRLKAARLRDACTSRPAQREARSNRRTGTTRPSDHS